MSNDTGITWEDRTTMHERMGRWTPVQKFTLAFAILLWMAIFIRLATMPHIFI